MQRFTAENILHYFPNGTTLVISERNNKKNVPSEKSTAETFIKFN